jgi:hypothetical protein
MATQEAALNWNMAERVGFEPTVEFPQHTLSKRAPSTTRTPLRALESPFSLTESCSRTKVSLHFSQWLHPHLATKLNGSFRRGFEAPASRRQFLDLRHNAKQPARRRRYEKHRFHIRSHIFRSMDIDSHEKDGLEKETRFAKENAAAITSGQSILIR